MNSKNRHNSKNYVMVKIHTIVKIMLQNKKNLKCAVILHFF